MRHHLFLSCACACTVPSAWPVDTGDDTEVEERSDRQDPESDVPDASDDTEPGGDSDPLPPDCAAIPTADPDWELCAATADGCEAVFTDGAGCDDVCAAAGLTCQGAYENRDGACAPDLSRAPLPCTSGHRSDFCVCGGSGTPVSPDPGLVFADRREELLAERMGFGRNAQAPSLDHLYVVTTLADEGPGSLRAALERVDPAYIVFQVDGRIFWEEDATVRSDKTVDGRGRAIEVDGTWKIKDAHDVILSDLTLTRSPRDGEDACSQSGDVITVSGPGGRAPADFLSHDLWFHHLDLHHGGDGLLDLRGATEVTVSWTRFRDHRKAVLAWQTSDGDPAGGMFVTFHHDHFQQISIRGPRFHYGRAHFLNNYHQEWWHYGAASYDGAHFLSEGNVYDAGDNCVGVPGVIPCVDPNPCGDDNDWFVNRKIAVENEDEGNAPGRVKSFADLKLHGAVIEVREAPAVFDAHAYYPYVVETASAGLAQRIAGGVGPRTTWTPP